VAISCAVNEDLRREWEKYLSETENHVRIRDGSPMARRGPRTRTATSSNYPKSKRSSRFAGTELGFQTGLLPDDCLQFVELELLGLADVAADRGSSRRLRPATLPSTVSPTTAWQMVGLGQQNQQLGTDRCGDVVDRWGSKPDPWCNPNYRWIPIRRRPTQSRPLHGDEFAHDPASLKHRRRLRERLLALEQLVEVQPVSASATVSVPSMPASKWVSMAQMT
jgi:hypothetical protein